MAESILIIGESGSGKSTSLRNLNAEETVVIRCVKKPLPFKGWKAKYKNFDKETREGNIFDLVNADNIIKAMQYIDKEMKHIKNIAIDDAQYIMAFEFMDRVKEKGYEKFTDIGSHFYSIVRYPEKMRDDLVVAFLSHSEDVSCNGFTKTKMKTIGKMLDTTITLEGLFTVVLQANSTVKGKDEIEYNFITQNDGTTTVKSPMGMFDSKYIPNDLNYVIERINKYNEG